LESKISIRKNTKEAIKIFNKAPEENLNILNGEK